MSYFDRGPWFPSAQGYDPTTMEYKIRLAFEDGVIPTEIEGDLRLIKAAPDLYEACIAAQAYLVDPASKFKKNREAAAKIIDAAVKKAEGKPKKDTATVISPWPGVIK